MLSKQRQLRVLLLQSQPTVTKGALAVGALGAAAVVLFNEVEIVLEVLGVAAAGNFVARKLLFAKDRDQTVDQIKYACCCDAPCNQIPKTCASLINTVSGFRVESLLCHRLVFMCTT